MTSALYDPIVLDHSRRPRHARLPPDATSVARGTNPLCGDQVDIAVTLDAHTLTDIGFEAKGCAVCIAAASVMSEAVRGLSLADVTALGERFEQRVAGAGDAASVAHELEAVASASRLPGRRDCGLLPWRTLAQALDPSPRSARPEPTPAEPDTKDALALAARWLDQGREVALATLVSAVGVGPCPPGSTLVVNESGEFFGSVSGGCVESAVVRQLEDRSTAGFHQHDVEEPRAQASGRDDVAGRRESRVRPLDTGVGGRKHASGAVGVEH